MKKLIAKIKSWFVKEKTTIDQRAEALVEKYVIGLKGAAKSELKALIEDVKAEAKKEASVINIDVVGMAKEFGVEKLKLAEILTKYIKGFKVTL